MPGISQVDASSVPPGNTRELLFSAIEQGRFESISQLVANYKRDVQAYLSATEHQNTLPSLDELLKPLADAIRYIQVMRAHQSAQFRKLAVDSLYPSSGPVSQRGNLSVDA
jgi:hypothetical protein